jgi:adenylate cyclase
LESDTKVNWLAGLTVGVTAAVVGLLLVYFSFGNALKFASYDLLFAFRPHIKPAEAVITYMDEDSHTALNQSLTEPWDRNLHARLLDRLTAAGARAVVFDIHFSGEGPDPQATANLAYAIKANGRVVLGADVSRAATDVQGIGAKRYVPPFEPLNAAAAEIGSVEVDAHHDLVVRKQLQGHADDLLLSLSWAGAKASSAAVAEFGNPATERWINYYGPPGTIPHISYHRALEAEPDLFKDKVVFIGARLLTKLAGERKDEFRSPYSIWLKEDLFISGVEIQATQFLNLVREDWLRRFKPGTERWLVVLIGLIIGVSLVHVRPWVAAALALAVAASILAITYFFFWNWKIWFPWLIPVAAQIPAALTLAILYNSFRLYLDNKLLEQSLSRHLSPVRAKQLLRRRELLQPGAEKQMLSIMFTDIADFTKLSEGMDSDELAKLMNNYFEEAIACVYETDGFLVKLIGDALFAIWNAPLGQPDHPERVFRSALLLKQCVTEFAAPKGVVLRTRIGIHTGIADVGNFGSAKRFDYTAIGENVNLASRLEGLNKYLGTQILASREAQAAVAGKFHFRYVGRFRLKGFDKSVEVYELLAEPADWHKTFADALQQFVARDFDAAEAGFCRVLKLHPNDGPTRFYLSQLEHLRANPPAASWSGEIEITEK